MAQLSTKIKESQWFKANGVSDVDFTMMSCCKTIAMVMVHISKNGI